MHKIFISYSQHEKDAVLFQSLVSQFSAIAGRVFLTYANLALVGSSKEEYIMRCIEEADTILLLVSDEYIANTSCKSESERALELAPQKNIVPILLRAFYTKELPYYKRKWLPYNPGSQEPVALGSYEDLDEACCSVVEEISNLIEKTESNSGVSSSQKYDWPAFFENSPIKSDSGIWMTVNCDRRYHFSEGLQRVFNQNRRSVKSHIYFLSACEYQKPASLAKRLVYEFTARGLNFGFTRVSEKSTELTEIEVKIGLEPIDTWSELWKEILMKLFVQADTPEELALKTRCRSYDKIAILLRVNEQHWYEQGIEEHLKYIVSQFDQLPNDARKFVIFFVFDFYRVHAHRKEECSCYLDSLESIKEQYHSDSILIEHYQLMPPVGSDDIIKWFHDRVQTVTQEADRGLMSNLKNQLESQDQKRADFDMIQVEKMQLEAWKSINKNANSFFDKKS